MDGNELASVLVKMACSPVKADREAIARIERECGLDAATIAVSLENSDLMALAITERKPKKFKILATGIFWGATIGIIALFIRPSYSINGAFFGFVAGVSGRVSWSDK